MQRQKADRRLHILSRLGGDSNGLETSAMDTFTQLINGDIGWRTDQDLTTICLGKMVDDGGRGDGLPCAWRALNQAQGFLQNRLDSIDLAAIQFRKTWDAKFLG